MLDINIPVRILVDLAIHVATPTRKTGNDEPLGNSVAAPGRPVVRPSVGLAPTTSPTAAQEAITVLPSAGLAPIMSTHFSNSRPPNALVTKSATWPSH